MSNTTVAKHKGMACNIGYQKKAKKDLDTI